VRPPHLYIHVPFCARRCSYCDFAIAVRSQVPLHDYLAGVAIELDRRYPPGDDWSLDTLYLGGGTPSRLGGDGVARLLDLVRARVQLAEGAEVTIEANPEDISLESVETWRAAGVNRLSIGAQSFDNGVLEWMHRTHTADDTRRAVEAARSGGIDNFSLDLIFALPKRLGRSWQTDVETILSLEPAHLSLYGLTVEPGTPLARWVSRGDCAEADEAVYEAEFLWAHDAAVSAGYEHYEVSNFARPGARSRHNSSYWAGVSYAALGPSAHEFDGTTRRWNNPEYAAWLRALYNGLDPVAGAEALTAENRLAERTYLELRTADGARLQSTDESVVGPWIDQGWARRDAARLTLTPRGWLRLDTLAADLTYARSR
jgi:oxygen-independent coproporphyrinogen III oxidase